MKDVDSEVPANEPCENTLCQERFQGWKGLTISLKLASYMLEFGAFHISNSFFFFFFPFQFKAASILKQNTTMVGRMCSINSCLPNSYSVSPLFLAGRICLSPFYAQNLPWLLVHGRHSRNVKDWVVNRDWMCKEPQHSTPRSRMGS